jgi:hypothetical protein
MQTHSTINNNSKLFIKDNRVNVIDICFYNCQQ